MEAFWWKFVCSLGFFTDGHLPKTAGRGVLLPGIRLKQKYESAADPGSLQVQNQPGQVCLSRHAVISSVLQGQGEKNPTPAGVCCPGLEVLPLKTEKK